MIRNDRIAVQSMVLVLFVVVMATIFVPFKTAVASDGSENTYTFSLTWGVGGSNPGQFNKPVGIAVDSSGNVFVTDTIDRVQKFTSSGTYLLQWGITGSGNGQFSSPTGLALDNNGNIYVADSGNARIQKFDSTGKYLTQWGSRGSGNGQFSSPQGVAVDNNGNVFVSDRYNNRVQEFTSAGVFISVWGSSGKGAGQFSYPIGIAVDSIGYVYVVDSSNSRVQKFGSDGTYLTSWGYSGFGNGTFGSPQWTGIDKNNNVFVSDVFGTVQKFTSDGTFLTTFGSYGSGNGQFNQPEGVVVDSYGNVYVVDNYNNRIQEFVPSSTSSQSPALTVTPTNTPLPTSFGSSPSPTITSTPVSTPSPSSSQPSSTSSLSSSASPTPSGTPQNPAPIGSSLWLYVFALAVVFFVVVLVAFVLRKRSRSNKQVPPTSTRGVVAPGSSGGSLTSKENPPVCSNYVFISHVERDGNVALKIAEGLGSAGFGTWYYERDSLPGESYLVQTKKAIEDSQAVVLIISPNSLSSRQITVEVVRAHEAGKPFIPLLLGITHLEFQNRQPEWREAIGASASIVVPEKDVTSIIPRVVAGLNRLNIKKESDIDR